MKECIILPNSIFDDGSLECKTFCVCTANDNTFVCEYSSILKHYSEHIPYIQQAIVEGKNYIGYDVGQGYCEIQWD